MTIAIDAYPEREFHGHVASVQPGSGTAFSLLPAENATGNYVKIVQRVPVKIILDNPPTDVALGPGMSVVPTVRTDSDPSLYERLAGLDCARTGAPPRPAPANPWLIAVLVALATFMEVLDTTIANVVLPYIAGGMGVSQDESSWVVTTYLVANAVTLTASSSLAQHVRPQDLLPDLPRAVHRQLGALRLRLEPAFAAAVPHPPGPRRRRHGAGLAIDPGGLVPAGEARPGLRAVRRRRGGGAGRRADARRLAGRQSVLALVLPDQRPGRPAGVRADRADPARIAGAIAEERKRLQREAAASTSSASCWSRPSSARSRSCSTAGCEDDWFASSFIIVIAAVCALGVRADDPVGDAAAAIRRSTSRMVATRQFGACFLVMLATGAILLATTQFLPQLVQEDFGYTATWAGLVLSPGGARHHGDDVRRRPPVGQGAAEIPDHRRRPDHRALDV